MLLCCTNWNSVNTEIWLLLTYSKYLVTLQNPVNKRQKICYFLDFVQSAQLIIHWLKPEKMVQRSFLKQPPLTKIVRKNRHGKASPYCPTQRYQPGTFSCVWAPCFQEDQPPKCFKCFAIWDLVVSCLICILWLYPKFIDSEPYLHFSIVKWLLVLQSLKLQKGILDDKLIVQVWQVHFLLGLEITEIIRPEFIFI